MNFKAFSSRSDLRVLAAVFLYFLVFHLTLTSFNRDDLSNIKIWERMQGIEGMIDYLRERYSTWSSRTIADLFMMLFTGMPVLVWKITDTFIATSVVYLICKIARVLYSTNTGFLKVSALVMVVLYPFFDMKTSGWVATTVNYLWPATGLLYLSLLCVRIFKGIRITLGMKIIAIIAVLFAGTHELICAYALIVEFSCVAAFLIYRRNGLSIPLALTLVMGAYLAYDALCPGNAIRNISTATTQFPSWDSFSTVEHLTMAFAGTYDRLTSLGFYRGGAQSFMMYFTLLSLILICVHRRYRSRFLDLLMVLPFLLVYLMNQTDVRFWSIWALMEAMGSEHMGQLRMVYQPALSVLLTALTCVGLYLSFLKPGRLGAIGALCAVMVFLTGLGTRVALGFSCTVYASNTRTYIALLFSMAVLIVFLSREGGIAGLLERTYQKTPYIRDRRHSYPKRHYRSSYHRYGHNPVTRGSVKNS